MSNAWVDKSKVTARSGVPELYVDGKRIPPLWYAMSDIPASRPWNPCSQRGMRNFATCDIDIVCVDTNLHEGWQENNEVDPTFLYKAIEAALQANPRAKVVTRLHVNPPYWWLHRHPEEHIVYYDKDENGQYVPIPTTDAGGYGDRTIARNLPFEIRASMASERWIEDGCAALDSLCRQVKAHPLGEALIGIQVAYGHAGEWHFWTGGSSPLRMDFSRPMQRLFREILREQYQTEEELRRYYGADATFDTAIMASAEEVATRPSFLFPEQHAKLIDTMRTHSHASANAICRFCESIKGAWGEGLLTGAFYGYIFFVAGVTTAHFEVERVLYNPHVDFLAAPSAYTDNKQSGNMNMLRYMAESCRRSGTLMLCEMDQGYRSMDNGQLYVCESEAEYASLMRRNVMETILLGGGVWFYDHRIMPSSIYEKEEYWNNEERLMAIREIQRACQGLLDKPYRKTTDVLLVLDTESRYHSNSDACSFAFIDALGKSGAGFDRLFLCDLERCDLSAYRCILFANCSVVSEATYARIKELAADGEHTLLFIGDFARVVGRQTVGEQGMNALFGGMPADAFAGAPVEGNLGYMSRAVTEPLFYKDLFRRAGAHIYTDGGEVVIADNELVMVHSRDIPETVLHLHSGDCVLKNEKFQTVVYNTYTGEQVL